MESNRILEADLLELVFEGRNKEYGAYQLRKHYQKRLGIALTITGTLALSIFLSSLFVEKGKTKPKFNVTPVDLVNVIFPPPPENIEVRPPDPRPTRTEPYTTPLIEPDNQVTDDVKPPEMDDLNDAAIGTERIDGADDTGIRRGGTGESIAPPATPPPAQPEPESLTAPVDQEAEFPGGVNAWVKYVSREIERNMDELQDEGKSGTVVAVFIVDKDGNVSEVKIVPCAQAGIANCIDPGSVLGQVALKAIKKGPKWKPAERAGQAVKAYRRQLITFRLE